MRTIPYQMLGMVRVGPAWNHIYAYIEGGVLSQEIGREKRGR